VADESTKPVAIRLQAAGHRVTRPRLAVVAALRELGGHHTADEVHAHLIRQNTALPRTSIYNSLVLLADLGLVMRADIGPGAVVYEAADGWHHHFVCRSCGSVHDVPCVIGTPPCLSPGADVGQVDEAQVIFRGICRNCLGDAQ
jgi:Fur family ferric uptake transcriptional regulator